MNKHTLVSLLRGGSKEDAEKRRKKDSFKGYAGRRVSEKDPCPNFKFHSSHTGGAERLIVDAAVELAQRGHTVNVFTAHHDPRRCFEETLDGKTPQDRLKFLPQS
jgi:hypothetical protein